LDEAKELFLKYLGNGFHMHRDGVLDIYRKYYIDSEIEKEWLNEHFYELIEKLKSSESTYIFWLLCEVIKVTKSANKIEYLMDNVNLCIVNWDSFERLRVAEEIKGLIEFFSKNYKEQSSEILKYKNIAIDIFNSVIHEQVVISEDTRQKVALENVLSEENLRIRAVNGLRDLLKY